MIAISGKFRIVLIPSKCRRSFFNSFRRKLASFFVNKLNVSFASCCSRSFKYLKDLEKQEADNTFELLTKKEAALRRKELKKLRRHLNGLKTMENLPDVAIIIDQKREITAIKECKKLGIPIVSILDTNCDPDLIDIPIPGNDDAVRSIKLILQSLTASIIKGKLDSNS